MWAGLGSARPKTSNPVEKRLKNVTNKKSTYFLYGSIN